MDHPPDDWLQDYAEGRLAQRHIYAVQIHLLGCTQCRERLTVFREYRRMEAEMCTGDPNVERD